MTDLKTIKKVFAFSLSLLVVVAIVYLRTSGLFRGLGEMGSIYHPDEPKQVMALFNFLNGDYVRYYGSLFYDGYPYGLNHLDEYLLRPILSLFQSDTPSLNSLYYHARFLRLLYGLSILFISGFLVYKISGKIYGAAIIALLLGFSPLAISVSHAATGDIGVDLFTALCLYTVFQYTNSTQKKLHLFLAGFTIGAAFSAKYNGFLLTIFPILIFLSELSNRKNHLREHIYRWLTTAVGGVFGIVLFTPALITDFKVTAANIIKNFIFIKNYNVPDNVLAMNWLEKALLSIQSNTVYIISSLGLAAVTLYFIGLLHLIRLTFIAKIYRSEQQKNQDLYLLCLALFPLLAFFISLSGKYAVQPFHFSYLQIPLLICCSLFLIQFFTSKIFVVRFFGCLFLTFITFEYAQESLRDNFFWRREDNTYHAQTLPASIYDREAFYTHRSGIIRSLYLEESGYSVFKNHSFTAKGPDADFWNSIEVAPLPQVANPIGKNWIFLNGPSYPRNERMLLVRAENHGASLDRYLVLPHDKEIIGFGIQSGSYGTHATIEYGETVSTATLKPHQQKFIDIKPQVFRESGKGKNKVKIIPLKVTVPHNSLWITILLSEKEKNIFNIFGGGQIDIPEAIIPVSENIQFDYFDILSRQQFLSNTLSWRVPAGKAIPMWEVALPAGRYTLVCEVEGLDNENQIAIELQDAKGDAHQQKIEHFRVTKNIQRIEYSFSKPFAPFQSRFVIHGIKGRSQILHFWLYPDYMELEKDFREWHVSGLTPEWLSRL